MNWHLAEHNDIDGSWDVAGSADRQDTSWNATLPYNSHPKPQAKKLYPHKKQKNKYKNKNKKTGGPERQAAHPEWPEPIPRPAWCHSRVEESDVFTQSDHTAPSTDHEAATTHVTFEVEAERSPPSTGQPILEQIQSLPAELDARQNLARLIYGAVHFLEDDSLASDREIRGLFVSDLLKKLNVAQGRDGHGRGPHLPAVEDRAIEDVREFKFITFKNKIKRAQANIAEYMKNVDMWETRGLKLDWQSFSALEETDAELQNAINSVTHLEELLRPQGWN